MPNGPALVPEDIDQHIDVAVLHAGGQFKFRERLRKDPLFLIGCIIVALSLFLAVFGPAIAPYDPTAASAGDRRAAARTRRSGRGFCSAS